MTSVFYSVYDKLFRNSPTAPVRASKNTVVHWVTKFTPFGVRNASVAARWGVLALATGLYFGQPRVYFQYIPIFGRYYDPKGRYFSNTLE